MQSKSTAKEHPILFSTPMVQAILEGRKTQTRRILKPQPWYGSQIPGGSHFIFPPGSGQRFNSETSINGNWYVMQEDFQPLFSKLCPYGKVGDILWVRETWQIVRMTEIFSGKRVNSIAYKAGRMFISSKNNSTKEIVSGTAVPQLSGDINPSGKWKPSIFLRKKDCRIFLEITNIRIERLQDISEEDAQAEGVREKQFRIVVANPSGCKDYKIPLSYKGAYANLWNEINKKPGATYEYNPWVWAITFKHYNTRLVY